MLATSIGSIMEDQCIQCLWKGTYLSYVRQIPVDRYTAQTHTFKQIAEHFEIIEEVHTMVEHTKSSSQHEKDIKPQHSHKLQHINDCIHVNMKDNFQHNHANNSHTQEHSERASHNKDERTSHSSSKNHHVHERNVSNNREHHPKLSNDKKDKMRAGGLCFKCKEKGHLQKDCPRSNSIPEATLTSQAIDFAHIDRLTQMTVSDANIITLDTNHPNSHEAHTINAINISAISLKEDSDLDLSPQSSVIVDTIAPQDQHTPPEATDPWSCTLHKKDDALCIIFENLLNNMPCYPYDRKCTKWHHKKFKNDHFIVFRMSQFYMLHNQWNNIVATVPFQTTWSTKFDICKFYSKYKHAYYCPPNIPAEITDYFEPHLFDPPESTILQQQTPTDPYPVSDRDNSLDSSESKTLVDPEELISQTHAVLDTIPSTTQALTGAQELSEATEATEQPLDLTPKDKFASVSTQVCICCIKTEKPKTNIE